MYILVSESFHIRLTGRSLLHPVKVKWRFRYKPEWFRERWNSLCKPHHHPPPSISYHLPSYGAGLKLTTQGKPLSEILPLKELPSSNAFPEIPYLRRKFPLGISPYLSLQGGWGLGGGGGGFWVESHGFQRGWRGDLSVLTAGGERDQALFIATQPNSFSLPPLLFTSSKKHSSSWD